LNLNIEYIHFYYYIPFWILTLIQDGIYQVPVTNSVFEFYTQVYTKVLDWVDNEMYA
jgi:hypothetical protein